MLISSRQILMHLNQQSKKTFVSMEKQISTPRQLPNKYIYALFLIATIVFVCLGDKGTAIIFGGIGLVFDPFDPKIPFGKRPLWQRVWLMTHLLLVIGVVIVAIIAELHPKD